MYVIDIKKQFYEYLIGKHIVILVHYDIDALCSCRILQTLIKYGSIQYTLIPIRGLKDLKTAYQENCDQINVFILINCGGTTDLVELLDPLENSILFVLDSHKPTDVCNIYSDNQIKLLWQQDDDQNVPNFEDIFNEDDEDVNGEDEHISASDDEHTDEDRASKRRRLGEEDILKRRERRLWEEKRNKLMFEYSQYTYYSKASAITLFDLAHTLAKDTKELLWLTILALSSQQILAQIESSQYTILAGNLQLEVERLNRRHNNTKNVASSIQISVGRELKVSLYRHWTVTKSLVCSLYTGCKMKLWSRNGERQMQELLAHMGLPLAQSKQRFNAMELTYRHEFATKLEKCGEKFALDDLTYPSFFVRFGYRLKYGAADMVHIILAILEKTSRIKRADSCFSDALDCLTKPPPANLLSRGLDRAKITLETCQKTMKAALDQKKIYSAGPFLYFILHESNADCHVFSKPHTLLLLARYIQQAYCERHAARASASALPLLISAPLMQNQQSPSDSGENSSEDTQDTNSQDTTQETNTTSRRQIDEEMCLLLGLPPLCENSPKSFFGKAFEQVGERSNAVYSVDFFDTSYIQLRSADRTRFLDSLTALLS